MASKSKKEKIEYIVFVCILILVSSIIIYFNYGVDEGKAENNTNNIDLSVLPDASDNTMDSSKIISYSNENSEIDRDKDAFDAWISSLNSIDSIKEQSPDMDSISYKEDVLSDASNMVSNLNSIEADNSVELQSLIDENDRLRRELRKKEIVKENSYQEDDKEADFYRVTKENATDREIAENSPENAYVGAKARIVKIELVNDNKVSSLGREEEPNNSFNSIRKRIKRKEEQNNVKAVVDKTITIKEGDYVPLRLKQSVYIDGVYYPKNHLVKGISRINNNRLDIEINSLEIDDHIQSTKLYVYDKDAQRGLYVAELNKKSLGDRVTKELGGSMQNTQSVSIISGDNNPVKQLATDAGRGIISGLSSYINDKLNEVKITIKAEHQVYIMSENDK